MTVDVRLLGRDEAGVLARVADDVFDDPIDPRWTAEFFADPRHHLAVALDDGVVVGMASAVHYVHPDKAPQLWINEVGVAPTHRGAGIGRRMVSLLCDLGRSLGCTEAWVATESSNTAARRLYAALGGEEAPEPIVMYTFRFQDSADRPEGDRGR